MNNPIITKKANRLAKSIVQKLWENGYWVYNEETYGLAKNAAIPVARMLIKERKKTYYGIPGNWDDSYLIYKALPKAINNLKYKNKPSL